MLTDIKITILVENRVTRANLIAEQGLSLYIETPEGNFLFDTGQSDVFLRNAEQLGIDLKNIKAIILSHGHYDHTNGLYYYLKKFGEAHVICHYNLFHKKYKLVNGQRMFIGISHEEDELKRLGARFEYVNNPHHLTKDIIISGEINRLTDFENVFENYEERVLESYIPDELHDDMALYLKTEKGLIVLMGCGHAGTINTIKQGLRLTNLKDIYAVMGGMHLAQAPEERIHKTVHGLQEINPRYIVPLHCTGFRMMNQLFNEFGERVLLFTVGDKLTLDLP